MMTSSELCHAGCEALARTFPVMQHLKQLCLSQTQLTDSNLDVMLKVLKVCCSSCCFHGPWTSLVCLITICCTQSVFWRFEYSSCYLLSPAATFLHMVLQLRN